MKAVAWYQFILCASVAQAHAVKQWSSYSWRSRENCTFFSLLSEFVYMWKTLHWFLRIYCNWDFYYFGAVSSGIVRNTWLFLTQRWLLFLLIVVVWQVFWWFWLYGFFLCCLVFSLLFLLLFLNFSLCDQLFLLTALWNVLRLHIIYIDLETDSSLDQTILVLGQFWRCKFNNTGSATNRI